jgi:small nuclear ribonucleoprotein (snRNP)-like protein
MRRIAILLLVLLAGTVVGYARMPEVGDQVLITQNLGMITMRISGTIVDVDRQMNLIEMNATCSRTFFGLNASDEKVTFFDGGSKMCIGTGTILSLIYLD